jgi:hypothetical protein
MSPFPVSSRLAAAPQIVCLSVQLHLNRLNGGNVFVPQKTAVTVQYIQLITLIFLQSILLQKQQPINIGDNQQTKPMCFTPSSSVGTVTTVLAAQPHNCAMYIDRR